MKKNRSSWLYSLLKHPVRLLIHLFYRRVIVVGAEKIPATGPVILIANHQNALMDPLVCSVLLRREINWLTRADVFRNPAANKILRLLNMLPVYRERDNTDLIGKNEQTFRDCETRLFEGRVIGLFPEGSHHGEKYLRPFRKGLARIVQRSYQKGIRNISIVPVGIDYSNYQRWKSDLVLVIGDPIDADACIQACEDSSGASCLKHISRQSEMALIKCMIHLPDRELYNALLPLSGHVADELGINGDSAWKHFESLRKLSSYSVGIHRERHEWLGISSDFTQLPVISGKAFRIRILIIGLIVLPFHILAFPFRAIVKWLAARFTSDPQFVSTFRFSLSAV
ncbi:MAG: hypothetical protein RL220_1693, partial [Bacteroidota bacterium]